MSVRQPNYATRVALTLRSRNRVALTLRKVLLILVHVHNLGSESANNYKVLGVLIVCGLLHTDAMEHEIRVNNRICTTIRTTRKHGATQSLSHVAARFCLNQSLS